MNMENKAKNFLKDELLKMENRMFWGSILGSSIGYLLITLWLNSIRATASLWFVWVLIIIQFALYFSIFIAGYRRSVVCGLNKTLGLITFTALAILGRINDWELAIIPLVAIIMFIVSAMTKNVSEEKKHLLSEK
jgi:hypothetical protein